MTPKSERFELRLDEDLLERVDEWRMGRSSRPSRAEAIRRLVEIGLANASGETVTFTDGEKLLMIMLRDIYKHLKIERGEIDPDFIGEILWGGHYWAASWKMPGLFHGHEDSPRELRFVVNVLDMWDFLERGYERLDKVGKKRVDDEAEPFAGPVRFLGFDGNNEATYLGIADFLIEKMNRFGRFKGRDLNSHMPTLEWYERMLNIFEPMRRELVGRDLDAGQITAILNARRR